MHPPISICLRPPPQAPALPTSACLNRPRPLLLAFRLRRPPPTSIGLHADVRRPPSATTAPFRSPPTASASTAALPVCRCLRPSPPASAPCRHRPVSGHLRPCRPPPTSAACRRPPPPSSARFPWPPLASSPSSTSPRPPPPASAPPPSAYCLVAGTPSRHVKVFVDECVSKVGAAMDKVIGETAEDLDCRFTSIRTMETNVGNFVTDIMRKARGQKRTAPPRSGGT